jgi:two-component system chemotaxis sensor kinase CheA
MSDIRDELLAAFEVEYREHIDAIRAALEKVKAGEAVDFREIFRRAHSLKGAARAVDLPSIEAAAHALESRFAEAMETGGRFDEAHLRQMSAHLDDIVRLAAALYEKQATPESGPAMGASEFLRVNAAQVQRLSSSMHELSSNLDLLDGNSEGLSELQARTEGLARLLERAQSRRALSRDEMGKLAQQARTVARSVSAAVRQQKDAARASLASAGRLRDEIERVALVPASSVFAGLETMVQGMAAEAGRQVEVQVEGLDGQADRLLLQGLRDPVIHLLRNAIAHGVEPPARRAALGKPETALIRFSVRSHAGRLELSISDDGSGPDLERIEAVAVQRGLLDRREEGEAPRSADRLLALVFEPGFSTAAGVDRVSGRGMGLSVVAEAARRAGGGAFMRRRAPFGTEVRISTPLSAARQPILLVYQGEQLYGLPTYVLERVVHAVADDFEQVDGRRVLKLDAEGNRLVVPVVSLGQVLGATGDAVEESDFVNIAVLRQGDERLGVRVDALREVRTATVSALTHPDVDDLVQGAVQLEQDEIAVVISPEALMRRFARNELTLRATPAVARSAARTARVILVVDDSVTTRTLERSILESNGYVVLLAVDGVDALARLRGSATPVDLIVADVEMPRMDGFQLLAALKGDAQFASIPVIMMTSRAAPEDVRRGMELGADAYLVKQTFDQRELLTTIGQLL